MDSEPNDLSTPQVDQAQTDQDRAEALEQIDLMSRGGIEDDSILAEWTRDNFKAIYSALSHPSAAGQEAVERGFDALPFISIDDEGTKKLDLRAVLKTSEGQAHFRKLMRDAQPVPMPSQPAAPVQPDALMAIVNAATALVDKLDECKPQIDALCAMQANRGFEYPVHHMVRRSRHYAPVSQCHPARWIRTTN